MSRVNYYQSAFNSQKRKTKFMVINVQNLKKWRWIYSSTLSLSELLSELKISVASTILIVIVKCVWMVVLFNLSNAAGGEGGKQKKWEKLTQAFLRVSLLDAMASSVSYCTQIKYIDFL